MKIIIGIIIVGVVALFFVFLKRKQDEVKASVKKRFAGKEIRFMDEYALYVAKQSDGHSHFRGTGHLVLSEDELYFERQWDRRKTAIPVRSIMQVGETDRLGGQSPGTTMLKVVFRNETGQEDAIAWKVRELERWVKEISAIVGHSA